MRSPSACASNAAIFFSAALRLAASSAIRAGSWSRGVLSVEVSWETSARSRGEEAEGVEADQRLDAAYARADRGLAEELDEAELGAGGDVGAAAELARPGPPMSTIRTVVAVLLAEQGHRAERTSPRRGSCTRVVHLEVVAHRVVGDLLDLGCAGSATAPGPSVKSKRSSPARL